MFSYYSSLDKILAALTSYAFILPHLVFIFGAGLMFKHFKNAFSGLFFFGLLISSLCAISINLSLQYHLFDSADDMRKNIQLISSVSGIAFFVQVIGFLLLVVHLIKQKNAGSL
jgi:chromate transport protein ChrA